MGPKLTGFVVLCFVAVVLVVLIVAIFTGCGNDNTPPPAPTPVPAPAGPAPTSAPATVDLRVPSEYCPYLAEWYEADDRAYAFERRYGDDTTEWSEATLAGWLDAMGDRDEAAEQLFRAAPDNYRWADIEETCARFYR